MTLRIGTRGSRLAMWQAEHIQERLRSTGTACELQVISTAGDRIQDRFVHEIGGKGVFVREIEAQLLAGNIDLAVHSLKDLPMRLPDGLGLTAVLARHNPGDVLVRRRLAGDAAPPESWSLQDFQRWLGDGPKQKRTVATGSLRRRGLLQAASGLSGANANAQKGDLRIEVKPLRGNVDTRIAKLLDSDWDGIVLAASAFERLGWWDEACADSAAELGWRVDLLKPDWFIPAASQGALAIEMRSDHQATATIAALSCSNTSYAVEVERAVLRMLGGDCNLPFACHVYRSAAGADGWLLDAWVSDLDGEVVHSTIKSPGQEEAEAFAHRCVAALIDQGVDRVLNVLGLQRPS